MNPNKPKPTTSPEPASNTPVSARKRFAGGLEPGVFRGSTLQYSAPPPTDPDDDLIAKVKAMDGSAMRHWLKQGTNRADYDQALANKGKTR